MIIYEFGIEIKYRYDNNNKEYYKYIYTLDDMIDLDIYSKKLFEVGEQVKLQLKEYKGKLYFNLEKYE